MKKFFALLLIAAFAIGAPLAAFAHCGDCGRVTQIEPYSSHRNTTGGAVAGALIGGALGNQIGKGDGRKVATVAGVVGGAYAGKEIAENSQKTRYHVTVRMDDGHTETVNQSSVKHIGVGSYVRIRDGKAVRQ